MKPNPLTPSNILPSLNALRAFEVAARHMSFKEAAAELHVSASAVGHLIADLEGFFGVKLFAREHRRIELTTAGRNLLPGIQSAFDQLRGTVRTFQDYQTDRPLVLSVEPTFCDRCLIPRLEEFRIAYPDISVRLDPSTDVMDPRIDDVDICIRYGEGEYPGLRADVIEDHEDIIIVCSPNLLNGEHPLREVSDLKWHTLIDRPPSPHYVNRRNWRQWFKTAGFDEPIYKDRLEIPMEHYALASAIQGQGVTLASRLLATEDLAAGRLVQPFDTYFRVDKGYYLLSSPASVNDPRIEAFRDWVLDQVDYSTSMLNSRGPSKMIGEAAP